MADLYVLDHRHSIPGALCEAHKGYVRDKTAACARLMVVINAVTVVVSICRPCARALARNARLAGQS